MLLSKHAPAIRWRLGALLCVAMLSGADAQKVSLLSAKSETKSPDSRYTIRNADDEKQEPAHTLSLIAPKVAFCELVRHPELYDNKLVEFSAIYASGPELAIFENDCAKTNSQGDVIAEASFNPTTYKHGSPIDKRARKLLRKGAVRVRAIGMFTDFKAHDIDISPCCRYKIEVQQLLDVEKVAPDR
jgi:hypothetical protein